jgi:hypothetical protein
MNEMKTYLDELKQYFENTPRDQVLKDFAKYDTEENNVGPTVTEFLMGCQFYHAIAHCPPYNLQIQIQDKDLTPRFSSDFFCLKMLFFCN